jgi:hypothetical protein
MTFTTIKFAIIVTMGTIGLHCTGMELEAEDQITVTGPVEVRLHHGPVARIRSDESVTVQRKGNKISIHSDQPTHIVIQAEIFQRLNITTGQLLVKLSGSERIHISQVSVPEMRISLVDHARLDADLLNTEHLQITLADQGRVSLKNLVADFFILDISDESDIDVAGQTRHQQVALSGYSHYDGDQLESRDANVALEDYAAGFIQAINTPTVQNSPFASLSSR